MREARDRVVRARWIHFRPGALRPGLKCMNKP